MEYSFEFADKLLFLLTTSFGWLLIVIICGVLFLFGANKAY